MNRARVVRGMIRERPQPQPQPQPQRQGGEEGVEGEAGAEPVELEGPSRVRKSALQSPHTPGRRGRTGAERAPRFEAAGRTPSPPPRVGHSHLHVVVPERRHSTSPTPPPASLASGNDRVRRSLSPTAPVVPPLRNLPQAQSSSVEGANPAQFLTPPPVTEEASGDRRPRASSKRGKKKFKFFSRSNVDPEGGDTSPEVKARQLGFNEAVRPRRYCVSVAFNTSHSERAFDYVLDIVRPELDTLVALIILEHNEQEVSQYPLPPSLC